MPLTGLLPWIGLCGYAYELLRLRRVGCLSRSYHTEQASATISAIVPARNEATNIITCLRALDDQHMPNMEVLLVDDQSQDDTALLARAYEASAFDLRILDGAPLPAGWLGKSWACWQGAAQAQGEWLLFIDTDVRLQPNALATMLRYATQHNLDMLSLMPRIVTGSLAEKLVLPAFFYLLMGIYPFDRVQQPDQPAFALGQCILIRQTVYRACAGHSAIRARIIEDVALASAVKEAGYRIAMLCAPDLLAVRMYDGWQALSEGMSKHASEGRRDTGPRALLIALRQAFLAWLPLDMLLLGLTAKHAIMRKHLFLSAGILFGAQFSLWRWALRRYYGMGAKEALLMPAGTLSYFLLAAWATLRAWRGKGMRWKGRNLAERSE